MRENAAHFYFHVTMQSSLVQYASNRANCERGSRTLRNIPHCTVNEDPSSKTFPISRKYLAISRRKKTSAPKSLTVPLFPFTPMALKGTLS
jgi:hypothetical protein